MDKKNEQINSQNKDIFNEITESGKEDSFLQNASSAEKNLLPDGIFPPYQDENDIRKITKEGLFNMLYAIDEQQNEAPVEVIGRKAINDWIWNELITKNIPTDILKGYFGEIHRQDAYMLYRKYRMVEDITQWAITFHKKPKNIISNSDLLNNEFLHYSSEQISTTSQSKVIVYLKNEAEKMGYLNQRLQIETKKGMPRIIHPKLKVYVDQLIKNGRRRPTQENHLSHISRMLTWLSLNIQEFQNYKPYEIPILQIKRDHLDAFRTTLKKLGDNGHYSLITVSERIYCIKSFFCFLNQHWGYPNPALRLKSIKAPRYRFRKLPSEKQCSELFDVINKYSNQPTLDRIAFRLMLSLGFRSAETAHVKWSDINIYTKTIIVHSKGGKEHLLPLTGKLLEDIHSLHAIPPTSRYLLGNNPVSIQKKLRQNYKLYSLIAGWPFPGGLHIFRHTFVTRLANKNVLPQIIKELARLEKMDTVSLYLHIYQHRQFLANEINKLKFN